MSRFWTSPKRIYRLEAIDKIVNGMISSRLFEVKADAEMWQVEIVQQISEAAKQRMLSILQQEKNNVIVEIEQSNLLGLDYTKEYTRADIECRLSELSSAVQPPNTDPLEAIDNILSMLENAVALNVQSKGQRGEAPRHSHFKAREQFLALLQQEKKEAERLGRIDELNAMPNHTEVNLHVRERLNELTSPPNTEQEQL